MSRPIALCIERVQSGDEGRYMRCTARPGREAGLALGVDGSILWCHSGPVACEVWVSRDQRLVAFRPSGAPDVRLERARRGVALPPDSPAFVLNGDEIVIGRQRFVVHVHGVTDEVHPPRPMALSTRAAALAAAVALGGVVGCAENRLPGIPAAAEEASSFQQVVTSPGPLVVEAGAVDADNALDAGALNGFYAVTDIPPFKRADASDEDAGVIPIEVRSFPPK